MIRDEIKRLFSNSDVNSGYMIDNIDPKYPAYVVRFADSFGVAVNYDGEDFREEFANTSIYTEIMSIKGTNRKYLFLTSSIESTRNEFAVFCEDFIDPGIDGEKRKELIFDPSIWWGNWKNLIGNAIAEKKPYALLGEMIVYEHLLMSGVEVRWNGPEAASHDLVTKDIEYEVKSTISRYDRKIHVTGQFQLQKDKELILCLCRFEKNTNGICINDLVERLVVGCGVSRNELNGKLLLQGYGLGANARTEKYQLHEIIQYKVDDSFPQITPDVIVGGQLPKGISRLEYDVDLSVVDGKALQMNK